MFLNQAKFMGEAHIEMSVSVGWLAEKHTLGNCDLVG